MSKKTNLPPRISGAELTKLTGLTDRRHRQLAEQGFFPAPSRGLYALAPTIQGLLRHGRDIEARAKTPYHDARTRRMVAEAARSERALDEERGRFVEHADVCAMLARVSAMQRAVLRAALEAEFPGKVLGRTASEIRKLGADLVDRICALMTQDEDTWPTAGLLLSNPATENLPNENQNR